MALKVVNKALGDRVRIARERAGLSQADLADAIGAAQSSIAGIEAGLINRPKKLHEISLAVGCGIEWLLGISGEHIDSMDVAASLDRDQLHSTVTDLPYADAVPQISGRMGGGSTGEVITIMAGDMQAVEPVAAWWRIPPNVIRSYTNASHNHIAGWLMDGDSMEPTINRSDIVFIDTHRRHIEPDGIWAVDYGLGRTLKRIEVKREDGNIKWTLMSDNPRYSPKDYAPEEVTIFGRYVFRFTMF